MVGRSPPKRKIVGSSPIKDVLFDKNKLNYQAILHDISCFVTSHRTIPLANNNFFKLSYENVFDLYYSNTKSFE